MTSKTLTSRFTPDSRQASGNPPGHGHSRQKKGDSPIRRVTAFVLVMGLALALVYGVLPWLTNNFSMTRRMAGALEETGIDPSRYFYTDVDQVLEAEQYLRTVLDGSAR